jgi:hypothetical protein
MFSTILALTMLAYLHLFQVLIVLDRVDLLPLSKDDTRFEKRVGVALVMAPIAIVLAFMVRKKDINEIAAAYQDRQEEISRGNKFLIAYSVLSFALLTVLMILFAK